MSDQALTIEALLDMTPVLNGQDMVRLAARHLLLGQVKIQESVHEVFFAGHVKDPVYGDQLDDIGWFNFDDYATLYVSQAIVRLQDDFQIHMLLREPLIEEKLQAIYKGPEWKKIGFTLYTMLFPDLVRDETTKVSFKRYLGLDKDHKFSAVWARRLSEAVCKKSWTCKYLNLLAVGTMSADEFNRFMNILFVKLHLLDPTTVMPTFDQLSKTTNNYLGEPLEWTLIKEDVRAAINSSSQASNVSKVSLDDVELYYGIRVCEFVMLEARRLDLWTGKYPDNKRISHFRDRCKVM